MGESTTTTNNETNQVREPWGPSQPHLQNIMNAGSQYYGQGVGSNVWQGPDVAPLNHQLRESLTDIWNTSHRNTAAPEDVFRSATGQVTSGGITNQMQPALGTLQNFANNDYATDTRFDNIYEGVGPTAAQTNLSGMAAGGGTNPFLTQMLDQGAQRISDQVNSSMSGSGRYGSFGHAGALNDRISEFQNPVLANAYETDRNRMLSASGQIDAARAAADQTRLAAEQGQQGVEQANRQNRLAGATGLLSNLQQGAQRGMGYAALSPQLYDAMYAPSERRAMVGDFMQGRDQQSLQGARERFESQENMPWQQLARYGAALGYISPFAGNAGTVTGDSTSTQTRPYGFMDYANLFQGGANSAASGAASALALPLMLSDRTTKTDIQKLGTSESTGLDIYAYRYKGDAKNTPKVVGPMAQDLRDKYPGSTAEIGGKLVVKPQYAGLLGAL